MMHWQRRRHPEDVPTPVAVAVADYCRRAKSPASPALVRDALSLLDAAADDAVRTLADSEPKAKLGPFAVVDVVSGTDHTLAAERQASGYYEQRRKEVAEQVKSGAAIPVLTTATPAERPAVVAVPEARPKGKAKPSRGPTLKERVAPKKRAAGTPAPVRQALPRELPGTAFLPKRNLPLGRGRFTTIDPSRASIESLFRPDGKETLITLIDQVPHRVALLRTLEQGYAGRRGAKLEMADVEDLLEAHELFERIELKETEGLLAALIDEKGSFGRAGQSFGMSGEELQQLARALGLQKEVAEVRDRFIREALSSMNLSMRLELLFRNRYLQDLDIERRFENSLRDQLDEMIDEVRDAVTSVPTLVDMLARQHALHAETLRRALEKLGLLEPWL